jgi:FkbM family methyltransferase
MLKQILKPWFIYQPGQLVRRSLVELRFQPDGYVPLKTSWGAKIIANPTRTIGRSIQTTGVHELAVSEALARLVNVGDTVIDAGANVGYMTVLAGLAAGPTGQVLSFEPHPEIHAILQKNMTIAIEQQAIAAIELYQVALGDQLGRAELQLPDDFETNDGIAQIIPAGMANSTSITVQVTTLDDVLDDRLASVLKLDVEGFEIQVLKGATRLLARQCIRHIVFEDHNVAESAVVAALRQAGYHLFSIGWALRGPTIQPLDAGSLATAYESPNFVATLAPNEVLARWRQPGWLVLGKHLTTHTRINTYA